MNDWMSSYLESKKEYISMGWMETVKLFSILSPSYMRERETWLTELLYSEGNSSSRLTSTSTAQFTTPTQSCGSETHNSDPDPTCQAMTDQHPDPTC